MIRISLRTNPLDYRNVIKREFVLMTTEMVCASEEWEWMGEGEERAPRRSTLGRFVYIYIHTARVRLLIHLGMRRRKYYKAAK